MEQQRLTIQVSYSCGCGFIEFDPTEARKHVRDTTHTVTVNGVIKPPQGSKRQYKKVVPAAIIDDKEKE